MRRFLLLLLPLLLDGVGAPSGESGVGSSAPPWTQRHVALADRDIDQWNSTRALDNVFSCHSLGWTTNHLKCAVHHTPRSSDPRP